MNKKERNAVICLLYRGGQTAEEIGKSFALTKQRVRQILAAEGVTKHDRRKVGEHRDEFLGVNLATRVKAALLEEAIKRNVSMSALASDVIRDVLEECGHKL